MANLIRGERFRWPAARIPYVVDAEDFPEGTTRRAKIEWAIGHWNSRSRLKFVPMTSLSEWDWVRFVAHPQACQSPVGRQHSTFFPSGQDIRCQLMVDGFSRGTVLHEMGHTAGLFHEHQRPDRDEYVTVMGGDTVNYARKDFDEVVLLTPYDHLSIMHYGINANLTAPGLYTVGQRLRLGFLDLIAIEQAHDVGRGDYWHLAVQHQTT